MINQRQYCYARTWLNSSVRIVCVYVFGRSLTACYRFRIPVDHNNKTNVALPADVSSSQIWLTWKCSPSDNMSIGRKRVLLLPSSASRPHLYYYNVLLACWVKFAQTLTSVVRLATCSFLRFLRSIQHVLRRPLAKTTVTCMKFRFIAHKLWNSHWCHTYCHIQLRLLCPAS